MCGKALLIEWTSANEILVSLSSPRLTAVWPDTTSLCRPEMSSGINASILFRQLEHKRQTVIRWGELWAIIWQWKDLMTGKHLKSAQLTRSRYRPQVRAGMLPATQWTGSLNWYKIDVRLVTCTDIVEAMSSAHSTQLHSLIAQNRIKFVFGFCFFTQTHANGIRHKFAPLENPHGIECGSDVCCARREHQPFLKPQTHAPADKTHGDMGDFCLKW